MANQRHVFETQRVSERRNVSVPARLTWKDASGAVRFVSVKTRDISDAGVFVECEAGGGIERERARLRGEGGHED